MVPLPAAIGRLRQQTSHLFHMFAGLRMWFISADGGQFRLRGRHVYTLIDCCRASAARITFTIEKWTLAPSTYHDDLSRKFNYAFDRAGSPFQLGGALFTADHHKLFPQTFAHSHGFPKQ